ncbi:MAG TPA: glycoside hydrolase family 2 TIM barrel-domain containing protein [Tepidisphaeraceae bacterium]|jgi:beta-galactosidase|nr:glycoside hydrolase family 2 TIM barrel-domain containing protein [Tepidisphaeraceae bacterium]
MIGRVGIAAVMLAAGACSAYTLIPNQTEYVKDLDGQWRFKLEQKGAGPEWGGKGGGIKAPILPAKFEPFEKWDYREGPEWSEIKVPGNWEMQGFGLATYDQPDSPIGLYRLEFEVPKEWDGRQVKINFDGVQNGAEVYCNGKPVNVDESSEGKNNFHQGGFTAFQADLTPTVKYGGKNLLAIRVYKNTKEVDMDTGDYFFLGGIHRKVTLFSVPAAHLENFAFRTKVSGEGKADVQLIPTVSHAGEGMQVEAQIEGLDAEPHDATAGKPIEWKEDHAEYWSAEKPKLYTLHVNLKDKDGKVIEQVDRRVGIREVSIEKGVFMVNHVPVKLAGICRHECSPADGSAVGEDIWRKDITMMKASNINAIRTSHYPYGSGFYDVCDEMGMYVMDEMAACWVATDTDALTPAFGQHARELARRDLNHPSVLVWAIGNENKDGKNDKVSGDAIRKIDDTRPSLASCHKAEESGGELDDRHYVKPSDMQKDNDMTARREKVPMIYLENPNNWEERNGADWGCLDAWGPVIQRTWDVVTNADHIPGIFLWEWADRAVADPNSVHLYDFFPKTGINLVKVKGLVDGFRNARPWLFDVKMAYAPITVDLKPVVEGDGITVHARNLYSFTDLSELKTTWRLMNRDKEIKSGEEKASLAPMSKGDLHFAIARGDVDQADALQISFEAADGRNVATYELRLKPVEDAAPALAGNVEGIMFPHLNLVTVNYAGSPVTGWQKANKHPGKLENITVAGKKIDGEEALYGMALKDVPTMDADVVVNAKAGEGPDAHVHAAYANGKFSYRVEWLNELSEKPKKERGAKRNVRGKADVQELGWVFAVPGSEDHFSWQRTGLWSWYPADHVARLSGTATPDSMDQEITKITRPDAFDFNSTKYNCSWATLADGSGKGIEVKFNKGQTYQVRAGAGKDGGMELVVNRYCCPPRDISTSVVPEMYFTMEKGKAVEGQFAVGNISAK